MEYLVMNGELYHHGIKGQKWGVRRWQNADGTYNEAGKKRYFDSNKHDRAANRIQKEINSFKGHEKEYSEAIRGLKYTRDQERAKANAQREKNNGIKNAVKKYNKLADKADTLQDVADKAYEESTAAYNALGKNKLSRIVEAYKGTIGKGSEAYKKYSKAYDKAVETQEVADEAYKKAKAAYTETGKTFAGRVLNNIRYDPSLKRNGGPGFMESIKIEAETGHPWDEKPRARDPWDEKPRRGSGYNI